MAAERRVTSIRAPFKATLAKWLACPSKQAFSGEGGIRTHVAGKTRQRDFQSRTLSLSVTSPVALDPAWRRENARQSVIAADVARMPGAARIIAATLRPRSSVLRGRSGVSPAAGSYNR